MILRFCPTNPTISICFTILSILLIIATLIVSVVKYPVNASSSVYIKRGVALTRLWHRKQNSHTNPLRKIHAYMVFKIHLYLTYMFVKYAYRYIDDPGIASRLKKYI